MSGKAFDGKMEFGDGYTTYFTGSLSGDGKDGKGKFTFTDGYSTSVAGDFTSEGSRLEGEFTVSDGYETFTYELDVDTGKKSALGLFYGTYEFNVPDTTVEIEMEVKEGKSGSTDHIITVRGDAYELSGGSFSRMDITINTTDKGSAQKPGGQPVDITNYTDEQLEELLNELGDAFYQDMMEKMESIE